MARTYGKGEAVQALAVAILDVLMEEGSVRGRIVEGKWRPATVALAITLHPDERVITVLRNDNYHDTEAYLRYWHTMAALSLLEEEGLIRLVQDGREYGLIQLKED